MSTCSKKSLINNIMQQTIDIIWRQDVHEFTKRSGIYQLKINNKIYVGSAVSIYKRIIHHLHHLRKGTHHNVHLQRCFNKYGEESLEVSILEFNNRCLKELIPREQYYIDKLNPELNMLRIAGSPLGFKMPESAKQAISKALKGKSKSEEHRRNTSLGKLGSKASLETRIKMSISANGGVPKRPIIRVNLETNEEVYFNSVNDCVRQSTVSGSTIRRDLNNKSLKYNGFKFKYA